MQEKNDLESMALILAYNQIRDHEEYEAKKAELECLAGSKIT